MKELLEKHGYLILQSYSIGFRESEMKSFAEFATHNDPKYYLYKQKKCNSFLL